MFFDAVRRLGRVSPERAGDVVREIYLLMPDAIPAAALRESCHAGR